MLFITESIANESIIKTNTINYASKYYILVYFLKFGLDNTVPYNSDFMYFPVKSKLNGKMSLYFTKKTYTDINFTIKNSQLSENIFFCKKNMLPKILIFILFYRGLINEKSKIDF